MDVDLPEENIEQSTSGQQTQKRPIVVPVDESHPFDLETYIAGYTGRGAVDRLIHIISVCPSVAPQALQLALEQIQQLRDPALYQSALSAYNHHPAELGLPPARQVALLSPEWQEEIQAKNTAERTKLEVELKTYSNNMIKESIRMAHRDLGDFYLATGDYPNASKHYTKSREFCTTSQHVVDMCLSVLELLIHQKNYSHIPTYVFKADATIDPANATTNVANGNAGGTSTAAPSKKSAEREKVQSKLDFAMALAYLGSANYEKAALSFLKLGPPQQLGDWIGKLVAPSDIAIYGTLCGLASLSRSSIRENVLQSDTFGIYIEQEPYVRELTEAYMSSNFKVVLELLARYSTRHYIDVHICSHVQDLMNLIRNASVVLYFKPFATIKLERMSAAFGWTVEEVEKEVVGLIQSGSIQGRVDSHNKILKAKKTDPRAELFDGALKAAMNMANANRKLLLRMRLQQADLVVKAPKNQGSLNSGHPIELLQGD